MKSAYEKALERFGQGKIAKLTDEQKRQLNDLDNVYKAKLAERELLLQNEMKKAVEQNDPETYMQLEKQLASERIRIAEELEAKKEAVRKGE